MRVDSSLEGYHRFPGFDSLSDFFGNLNERVPLTDITVSVTVNLRYYIPSHRRNPRLTTQDRRKGSQCPMRYISSHEMQISCELAVGKVPEPVTRGSATASHRRSNSQTPIRRAEC